MFFCSFTFILIFLPLLLLLYYINKNIKYRNVLLLIFSIIFYAWGEPKYVLLLIFSIILNYFIGILISKKNFNKYILYIGIFINLLLIGVFKYLDFSIITLNRIFKFNINLFNIEIPIGISFYTFQVISYLVDVYKKSIKVEKNILNFGLYISLFPQLVAGPIVRYSDIACQIYNRKESVDKFYFGIKRFMIGFIKKIIIANNMAVVSNVIYSDLSFLNSMPVLWIGAIAFSLNIYYDFSSYSDMAIGLGSMFGFTIPENFNYPYTSFSISEFFRRWNISLGNWFKEYVYIPLGGNRVSKLKFIRNILIVFFLTGLWHGASYNYIIWGLYNGFFIIIEKTILEKKNNKKIVRYILTTFIIIIGLVIFRTENLSTLIIILKKMFDISNLNINVDILKSNYKLVLSALYMPFALIFIFPIKKLFNKFKIYKKIKWIEYISFISILILYLYSLVLILQDSYNYFIYFRF